MIDFARPVVVISRCIEFDSCRYDGSMVQSEFVQGLRPYVDFIPVCAELEIGLGVPRGSIRIVSDGVRAKLVQPSTGLDLTSRMREFSDRFLEALPEVDGFMLKYRSPSCGMKDVRVYSASSNLGTRSKTAGFFGAAVLRKFQGLAVEDEGRLRNLNIRNHFLTKIYALAGFRRAAGKNSISELASFHARNKYLLMAHSQAELRTLGNIVANRQGLGFQDLAKLYRQHLMAALEKPPRPASNANVLSHMMGYFSGELSGEEKEDFARGIERYRNRKVPLSALTSILRSWIARFDEPYLKDQTFFQPYPEELVELCADTQCEWSGEELFEGRRPTGAK
jgi:uncharacterized protein YbgA (DUF1722 family)/uncharacterized protein YbbK (DUF523 family)